MGFHLTPVRTTEFGKMSTHAGMDVGREEQVFAVSGSAKLVYPATEISEERSQKARNKSTTSSSYTIQGNYPRTPVYPTTEILAHPCSVLPYSHYAEDGNHPDMHQLMNRK